MWYISVMSDRGSTGESAVKKTHSSIIVDMFVVRDGTEAQLPRGGPKKRNHPGHKDVADGWFQ